MTWHAHPTGVIAGILTGAVYALMASGLTLIFGVMDIINVAQGALVILGAYLSYVLQQNFHIDLFLGLLITMPVMFVLGVILEWAFDPPTQARSHHPFDPGDLCDCNGDRRRVEHALLDQPGPAAGLVFDSLDPDWQLLPRLYPYFQASSSAWSCWAGCICCCTARSSGFSLRASMQNRTAAQLIGIDVERVSAMTFGIGVALAAAGGMAYGATNTFNPNSHYDLISRLLVIIILAGWAACRGALIASVGMLVIEDVTALVWSPLWASTVFFILLVIMLLVRPQGLFGKQRHAKSVARVALTMTLM